MVLPSSMCLKMPQQVNSINTYVRILLSPDLVANLARRSTEMSSAHCQDRISSFEGKRSAHLHLLFRCPSFCPSKSRHDLDSASVRRLLYLRRCGELVGTRCAALRGPRRRFLPVKTRHIHFFVCAGFHSMGDCSRNQKCTLKG